MSMSIKSTNPELLAIWHPNLNTITPEEVTRGSSRVVWWRCQEFGHAWETTVKSVALGSRCQYCSGRRVLPGFNDFETYHPDRAKNWHPTKNSTTPRNHTKSSSFSAWFQCDEGHEFQKSLNDVHSGKWCKYCAKKGILPGYNDLFTVRPDLAEIWHPTLNSVDPNTLGVGSRVSAVWMCSRNDHNWTAQINNVTSGQGCAVCAGQQVWPGFNDFKSNFPEEAGNWSAKNTVNPENIAKKSSKKYWFTCDLGHDFEASPTKIADGRWCKYCSGKSVLVGFNDLFTTDPELQDIWSPRNTIDPRTISRGSYVHTEWLCESGHYSVATPYDRAAGKGCPSCSGRVPIPGESDILTTDPKVATLWSDDNVVDIRHVSRGSGIIAKWTCEMGHTWEGSVSSVVSRGSRCKYCYINGSIGQTELTEFIQNILPGHRIETNYRGLCTGLYQVDIYIPEKKIALEYNGLYWHSDAPGLNPYPVANKMKECSERDVDLYVVWEDDWRDRQDVVKSWLANLLDCSEADKLSARRLKCSEISYTESSRFLDKHHIQGGARGTYYVSLSDSEDTISAVGVFTRTGRNIRLDRYATSANVRGGFSKMMSWVDRNIDYEVCTTFADKTYSRGKLYSSTGWVEIGTISPDYRYVHNGTRRHKFNYRIDRFKHDTTGKYKYKEGLTERELTRLNGLWRIYDAGKIKYERRNPVSRSNNVG